MNGKTGKQPPQKQQATPGKQAAPPPPPPSDPGWASGDVIGYTFHRTVDVREVLGWVGGKVRKDYPTVYYKKGRRTVQHSDPNNVRWHTTKRDWVFFGNVVKQWLDEDYWSMDRKDPKKESKNLLIAVELLQTAATKQRAPLGQSNQTDYHLSTSYFDPMTKRWEKDMYESKFGQQKVKLLEIFWQAGKMTSHPSRNRFRWVDSNQLKSALHELALKGA